MRRRFWVVAYALDRLIGSAELSAFEKQYCNDEDGTPVIAPAVLFKAIRLGYSQGEPYQTRVSHTPSVDGATCAGGGAMGFHVLTDPLRSDPCVHPFSTNSLAD